MITFQELYEGIRRVDVIQRKKQSRRMAKLAKSKSIQFKKQKAALKMRDSAKLQAAAKKSVIKSFRKKFVKGYDEMSLQQRVVADQKLNQRFGKKIDAMTKRMVKKLAKQEVERVKQARAALRDKE